MTCHFNCNLYRNYKMDIYILLIFIFNYLPFHKVLKKFSIAYQKKYMNIFSWIIYIILYYNSIVKV